MKIFNRVAGNAARLLIKAVHAAPLKARVKLRQELATETHLVHRGVTARFSIHSSTELRRVSQLKEIWTADWVASLPPRSVLWDVGANIGIFTILAAIRPDIEDVVCIEPSSINLSTITENLRLNNITNKVRVVSGGVGDVTTLAPLNLANVKPGGAFHSFGNISFEGKVERPGVKEWCFLWRIDDLVNLPGMPFPTHLKIDVDGYEAEVLAGAAETLRDERLAGAQIEVMEPVGHTAVEHEIATTMAEAGFSIVARHRHGENALATDLQFERRSVGPSSDVTAHNVAP